MGEYSVSLTVTDNEGASASDSISISATDIQPDQVIILKAEYTASKEKIRVEATSSEQPGVTLTLTFSSGSSDYSAPMPFNRDKYKGEVKNLAVGPTTVTVTSSAGGSATKTVKFN